MYVSAYAGRENLYDASCGARRIRKKLAAKQRRALDRKMVLEQVAVYDRKIQTDVDVLSVMMLALALQPL